LRHAWRVCSVVWLSTWVDIPFPLVNKYFFWKLCATATYVGKYCHICFLPLLLPSHRITAHVHASCTTQTYSVRFSHLAYVHSFGHVLLLCRQSCAFDISISGALAKKSYFDVIVPFSLNTC
jgi:hypothetical protein